MSRAAALAPATRRTQEQLADRIAREHREDGWRIVGISGAQGSGKSTLAARLLEHLRDRHSLQAVTVSLDDFYLSRAARTELAGSVHPLLATRGVPGTHDVQRGIECVQQLRNGQPCQLPAFSKAADDVLDTSHDRRITQPPDLVLFEGWCVGVPPQDGVELETPVNELEQKEDPDGSWRRSVNQQLSGPYAKWWDMLDGLVFLQVPGWDQVRQWRAQQERETAAAHGGRSMLDNPAALDRFLQHYQRLTLHSLAVMPARADAVVRLDREHGLHLS